MTGANDNQVRLAFPKEDKRDLSLLYKETFSPGFERDQ
jgi:hypothetical protein